MTKLQPYIRFNGNAKEAFTFYKSVLGGDLSMTLIGQSPMADFMKDKKDQVFHAQLTQGNLVILGSDLIEKEGLRRGNGLVLTLIVGDIDSANTLFDQLSKGGKIGHPLSAQSFGTIGDFTDKFGVGWFIFVDQGTQQE